MVQKTGVRFREQLVASGLVDAESGAGRSDLDPTRDVKRKLGPWELARRCLALSVSVGEALLLPRDGVFLGLQDIKNAKSP